MFCDELTLIDFGCIAVLIGICWYWPPPPPPPLPPLASLQGIPPELRNQIYELVAANISERVISGKNLVAAHESPHHDVDVASILLSASGQHPLSKTSRQLRAEFRSFEERARPSRSEYRFLLDNFDLKQSQLIADSIRALDKEAAQGGTTSKPYYHICIAANEDAVSSAEELCSFVEQEKKLPPALEYIKHHV